MEASKATGLSVLDADRLVAEMRLPVKVRGVLGYAPEVDGVLRTALSSILGELGYADRAVMGVRVPFRGTDRRPLRRTVAQVGRGRCRQWGRPL